MAGEKVKTDWWAVLVHSVRTAAVAMASYAIARLFRLPEAYWAAITTIVITQSSLGAALTVSWQRFAGTIVGGLVGALLAARFVSDVLVFGACVLVLGLLCAAAHLDRTAYRFAGVTVAIVLLIPRVRAPWAIALHRCAEVIIGIVVALLFAVVWPEPEEPPTSPKT